MQITRNTSGLIAGVAVCTDKDARDHAVAVVKGTFRVMADGSTRPADIQRGLVFVDDHYGDPGVTSVRNEADFSPPKALVDVLVHGHAVTDRPVTIAHVSFEFAGYRKDVLVTGDRRWERTLVGLRATPAAPFERMPLVFERAFGGIDVSHPNVERHGCERRNPVGVGFRANPRASDAVDTPLPNLEDPRAPLSAWNDRPPPIGLGFVGRSWLPRLGFAGTYDARWLAEVAPFLPQDFDLRYFQAAPSDQQFRRFSGGQVVKVLGTRRSGPWVARIPDVSSTVRFRFRKREVVQQAVLDTVMVDCDADELVLTWRASTPLSKQPAELREIEILGPGDNPSRPVAVRMTRGKPHFAGLAACLAWLRGRSEGP